MISSTIQEAFDDAIRDIGVSLSLSTDFLSPPMELLNRTNDFRSIKTTFESIYGSIPMLHRNILNSSIILTTYASYEAYVHELMELYIGEYTSICHSIDDVDDALQNFHLRVIAERVRRGKAKQRNSTRFVDIAIAELSNHISGSGPISFDKSICREQHNNFRLAELSGCLSRIGARGFIEHLKQSEKARELLGKSPLSEDDVRLPLEDFVVTRNEIMHSFDVAQSKGKDWIEAKLKLVSLVVSETNVFLGLRLQERMERSQTRMHMNPLPQN